MKLTGSWDIIILLAILCCQLLSSTEGTSVVVTDQNWEELIESHELVLLSFYASWCLFSQMLGPIFEEAAAIIHQKYPEEGHVILGKVDCDQELDVTDRFDIIKYPTLKVARNGLVSMQEYRGQRSVEALVQFVERELMDPVQEFHSLKELQNMEVGDGLVIGYFISRDHPEYTIYRKVASILRNECRFMVGFGEVSEDLHPPGKNLVIFRGDPATISHREYYSEYSGNMTSFKELSHWSSSKCEPLVREITFDNAEELTEEGLPFVLVFYDKSDLGPVRQFKTVVQSQLANETRVNFLTADGALFVHPLFHIGVALSDLPVIVIDSFQHMYRFPKFEDIHKPGVLEKFINDLFNGQLHYEYHFSENVEEEGKVKITVDVSTPVIPESKFKELLPSKHRYTLLNRSRDEL